MISYLEGVLKKIYADKVTLGVGGVGYEVLIPAYVMNEIRRTAKVEDTPKALHFLQSDRKTAEASARGLQDGAGQGVFRVVHNRRGYRTCRSQSGR